MKTNDVTFVKVPVELEKKYGSIPLSYLKEESLENYYSKGAKIELISYSKKHGAMGISRFECKIVAKKPGDLMYENKDVYIHACDTNDGSSGGVLVATYQGRSIIVGIHTGMNLNLKKYKIEKEKYPDTDGFPDGIPFDPKNAVGVAINFKNPVLTRIYNEFKYGLPSTAPSKKLIKAIQVELYRLGYEPGPADGLVGKKTRTAIRRFQSDRELTESTETTKELLRRLKEE